MDKELELTPSPSQESEGSANARLANHEPAPKPEQGDQDQPQVALSDLLGQFGLYQLSVCLIAFLRFIHMALMTNSGPLLAPSVDFWCQVDDSTGAELARPANSTMEQYLAGKCQLQFLNGTAYQCDRWRFDSSRTGVTMTDTFGLVCGRDWLRSFFQSTTTIGVVGSSLIGGCISDELGRMLTVKVSFVISLISGAISWLSRTYLVFSLSRAICTFGDMCLVVSLSTMVIETTGVKYRGGVGIVVYTGWSIGVMIIPYIAEYFRDFKQIMLFTVILHVATLPWLLTIRESVRWLLVNGRFDEAKAEINRIRSFNSTLDKQFLESSDVNYELLKVKFVRISSNRWEQQKKYGFIKSALKNVRELFRSKELAWATATLIFCQFNTELFYMLFILINSDIGDSIKLNYLIGGIMEITATIVSIFLIEKFSRKSSFVITMISVGVSCIALGLTHSMASISIVVLNVAKFVISTLASLMYVVLTEAFPTNMRQTGYGICGTFGSIGGIIAPFIREELVDYIGMTRVMSVIAVVPFLASIMIPLFLRETKGQELLDDIDEIELANSDQHNKSATNSNNKI